MTRSQNFNEFFCWNFQHVRFLTFFYGSAVVDIWVAAVRDRPMPKFASCQGDYD